MKYPKINHLQEAAVTSKTRSPKGRRDDDIRVQEPESSVRVETPGKGLPKRPAFKPCRRDHQLELKLWRKDHRPELLPQCGLPDGMQTIKERTGGKIGLSRKNPNINRHWQNG